MQRKTTMEADARRDIGLELSHVELLPPHSRCWKELSFVTRDRVMGSEYFLGFDRRRAIEACDIEARCATGALLQLGQPVQIMPDQRVWIDPQERMWIASEFQPYSDPLRRRIYPICHR